MILVVDDHYESSRALVVLLRTQGFEATAAECAPNALAMMKRSKPSLVILDCHMPEFDGFMMLQVLKETPNLADVPVVMFSSGDASDEVRSLELGARAFVRKGTHSWPQILALLKAFAADGEASRKLWRYVLFRPRVLWSETYFTRKNEMRRVTSAPSLVEPRAARVLAYLTLSPPVIIRSDGRPV
jgi:DNA-binding response OmpR family regulator